MKKKLIISSILLTLIMAFQNCSPQKVSQNDSIPSDTGVDNQTPMNQSPAPTVDFLEIMTSPSMPDPSTESQKLLPASLLVDLVTGEIASLDRSAQVDPSQKYCLLQSELSAINTILKTSQICESSTPVSAEIACAMIYRSPYAKLHTPESEILLGESRSSCEYGPDLCGEHKKLLQEFITSLLSHISQRACAL